MKQRPLLFTLLASVAAAAFLAARAAGSRPAERTLDIVETVRLRPPQGARSLRLWIPRLAQDAFQTAELVSVESPWPHRTIQDPDFANPLLYMEPDAADGKTAEIRLRYRVSRREQDRPLREDEVSGLFLEERGLVVLDDEVRRIAGEVTQGLNAPLEKARALYNYVLSRMDYDTRGDGWGRGDVVYACKIGKGNCTDFHSLFIALARASAIPARFKIGYPLPEAPAGAVVKPYHCWAEFHVAGKGWLPVDISEAWKRPGKADYFFGRLDADRVLVSTGREIRLSPSQAGKPLNYLVRPYAEADGKPLYGVEIERSYKEIAQGDRT